MRKLLAALIILGAAHHAWANIPANTRINCTLTPSHRFATASCNGDDGTGGIPLTWSPVQNIANQSGASTSLNFRTLYLSEAGSPSSTFSLLNCSLPSGWSLTTDGLSYSGSGTGSAMGCQMRATRLTATADTNAFSITTTAPPGADTQPPTIPEALTCTGGASQVVCIWDPSSDLGDGTNVGSGLDHYELLLNGSHLADIAAPIGITGNLTTTTLGSFSPTATAVQSGTSWTLTAAGTGFHNTTAEQGIFVGLPVTGDFVSSARIASFSSTYEYSTGGEMTYETVGQGQKFYFNYQEPSLNSHGPQTKTRVTVNTNSSNIGSAPGVNPPTCLKTTRVGNLFTTYYSNVTNCSSWTQLVSPTLPMNSQVTHGLALSSQSAGTAVSLTLDQFMVSNATQVSYTHSTATGGTYTVRAYDKSGNVSAVSNAVTAVPTSSTPPVKWHPGIYVLGTSVMYPGTAGWTSAQITEIGGMSNVVGWEQLVAWSAIETSQDVYDFTQLDALLAACKAQGKRLVIQVLDRTFSSGTTNRLPAYLATLANADGGWYTKPNNAGVIDRLWLPAIQARWQKLWQAIGAHWDNEPYFEGIVTAESDTNFSTGPSDYTAALWKAGLENIMVSAVAALPHTNVWASSNFLPSSQTDMMDLIGFYSRNRIGFTSPDTVINGGDSDWGTKVTRGYQYNGTAWVTGGTDYRGTMAIAHDLEDPEMGGKEGGFSADTLYSTWSHGTNHDAHWFQERKNFVTGTFEQLYWDNTSHTGTDPAAGHYTPDLKTYDNAGGHPTYTACPTQYTGGCNTN